MATLKEMFEGNTSKVLEATELLKVLGDRDGQFVWKQLTAEGGDFVAFVTADDENSYPDGGMQEGYWYELVEEGASGIEYSTITLSSSATSITQAHGLKVKPQYVILLPLDSNAVGANVTSCEVVTETTGRTGYCVYQSGSAVDTRVSKATPNSSGNFTDTTFKINAASSSIPFKGSYLCIVVA